MEDKVKPRASKYNTTKVKRKVFLFSIKKKFQTIMSWKKETTQFFSGSFAKLC